MNILDLTVISECQGRISMKWGQGEVSQLCLSLLHFPLFVCSLQICSWLVNNLKTTMVKNNHHLEGTAFAKLHFQTIMFLMIMMMMILMIMMMMMILMIMMMMMIIMVCLETWTSEMLCCRCWRWWGTTTRRFSPISLTSRRVSTVWDLAGLEELRRKLITFQHFFWEWTTRLRLCLAGKYLTLIGWHNIILISDWLTQHDTNLIGWHI